MYGAECRIGVKNVRIIPISHIRTPNIHVLYAAHIYEQLVCGKNIKYKTTVK